MYKYFLLLIIFTRNVCAETIPFLVQDLSDSRVVYRSENPKLSPSDCKTLAELGFSKLSGRNRQAVVTKPNKFLGNHQEIYCVINREWRWNGNSDVYTDVFTDDPGNMFED
jgi:hypothetical protein